MNIRTALALALTSLVAVPSLACAQEKKPKPNLVAANTVVFSRGVAIKKYRSRRGGRKRLRRDHRASARAIDLALKWLNTHQDADGKWDAVGFGKHDNAVRTGANEHGADVIVTGLALYTFLADGSTMRSGPYKDAVKKAVVWLRKQRKANGAFGDETTVNFVYGQAIATLAMGEAYFLSNYKTLRKDVRKGIECLETYRHPQGGWRNGKSGGADPSLTLWCTLAYMTAADDVEFTGVQAGFASTGRWLGGLVDSETGRVKRVPVDRGPLGTSALKANPSLLEDERLASILFSQYAAGLDPSKTKGGMLAVKKLGEKLPEWKKGEMSHYELFCASHVLYQGGGKAWGGDAWETWSKAMDKVITKQQRDRVAAQAGSWNPDGVWGKVGGRVYSTAMMALTLQSYYHYAQLAR